MQGVLIYTVAGAEGSYGGLITQAEPNKLAWIIESALERAKECSSDPVCYHAEEQGVGGLILPLVIPVLYYQKPVAKN